MTGAQTQLTNSQFATKSLDQYNLYNLQVTATQIAFHCTRFTRCTIKVIITDFPLLLALFHNDIISPF